MATHRIFSALDSRYVESEDINRLIREYHRPNDPETRCNFVVLNWDIVLEKHFKSMGFEHKSWD